MAERWPERTLFERYLEERKTPAERIFERLEPLIDPFTGVIREQIERMRTPPTTFPGVATNADNITLQSLPMGALAPDPYGAIPPEDRELMERCLKDLEPDIFKQTQELIKTEIRDSMVLGGNWTRLKELLKSGAKPRVVRKRQGGRDPLFLQFGDGVNTEIEEVRVLG